MARILLDARSGRLAVVAARSDTGAGRRGTVRLCLRMLRNFQMPGLLSEPTGAMLSAESTSAQGRTGPVRSDDTLAGLSLERRLRSWATAHGLPGRRRPAGRRIRWFPIVRLCQTTPLERLTASVWRLRWTFAFRCKKPLLQHTFRRYQTVASRPELGSSTRAKSAFAFLQEASWRLLERQASRGFDIGLSLEIA